MSMDVVVDIMYFDSRDEPVAYMVDSLVPPGGKQSFAFEPHVRKINDMRAHSASNTLSLDTNGFELREHHTALSSDDFRGDASAITGVYYEEMKALIRSALPGATRVEIFDHNVRKCDGRDLFEDNNDTNYAAGGQVEKVSVSGPVMFAHNDYTDRSAPMRLRALAQGKGEGGSYTSTEPLLTAEEAAAYEQKRFAIVQVRPPLQQSTSCKGKTVTQGSNAPAPSAP
jgi:hypothetical protein